MIENKYLVGAAVGVAGTAAAVYVYNKKRVVINDFLRQHGIDIPEVSGTDYSNMSLEELVSTKEHIEDLVAEREQISEEA